MNPAIDLRAIAFRRNDRRILSDVNWQLSAGSAAVLLGPNGAGKSTLVNIISGRLWPTEGTVRVLGELYGTINLREFRRRIGLFQPADQEALIGFHPRMSALDVICTGADGSLALYNEVPAAVRTRAVEMSHQLSAGQPLADLLFEPFGVLSSGERRKVLLLRTFFGNPELVIADEPYESLDVGARLQVEGILRSYGELSGSTILFVLHRAEEIPGFVKTGLMLKGGRVHASGSLEDIMVDGIVSDLYDSPLIVERLKNRYVWLPRTESS